MYAHILSLCFAVLPSRLRCSSSNGVLQITLVGKIISAHEAPTHLSFTIDDGTGKIELSFWTSGDDEQEQVRTKSSLHLCHIYETLTFLSLVLCTLLTSPCALQWSALRFCCNTRASCVNMSQVKLMMQFADGTKEGRLAGWCICAGAWAPEKF
jgi:hypothetical protein